MSQLTNAPANLLKLGWLCHQKNRHKPSLRPSSFQRNLLVGTLLGDAHLEPKGTQPNCVYRYYFSQKESKKKKVM